MTQRVKRAERRCRQRERAGTTFFDVSRAVRYTRGIVAPRTDTGPAEKCFVALDSAHTVKGFLQEFKDGSAAYWMERGGKGLPASSLEAALNRVMP